MRFLLLLIIASALLALPAKTQLSAFQSGAINLPTGKALHYKKSNWDGTHDSHVWVYFKEDGKAESFKWWEGDETATLVSAAIDWNSFSPMQLWNHRLAKGKDPQLVAWLEPLGRQTLQVNIGPMKDTLVLEDLPWHSYDFDWVSLSMVWHALKDKKAPFHFYLADAGMLNGVPKFMNKGKVEVNFEAEENWNEKNTFRYAINGPALQHKGGHIWIDPQTWTMVQFKLQLPDEEGYTNNMMQLLEIKEMNRQQWQAWIQQCLSRQ